VLTAPAISLSGRSLHRELLLETASLPVIARGCYEKNVVKREARGVC
jgi:hypothetical protein